MRRTARSSEGRRSASAVSRRTRGVPGGQRPPVAGPQRTCVACRQVRDKRDLVRIVRSPSGELSVDPRGKAAGRGAYCDPDPACVDRGLREGALARALQVNIDAATADRLRVEMTSAASSSDNER